jgi:putative endonuclease
VLLSKIFGKKSEDRAVDFLQAKGFAIVERNFYASKLGEIDIIAKNGDVLHFIEVKASRGSFEPIYNITPQKLQKVIKSAEYYLKKRKLDFDWCIDALIVKDDTIELIENITL